MEVHVDSAKRDEPGNDRAAPSPSMTSSLAMLSTENSQQWVTYMLENCVIIEVCDQRNLYRTGLGS